MLRELTLICEGCGAQKIFEGENLKDIIKVIDKSEWTDKPDHGRYPLGYMPGICPDCIKKRFAM